MCGTSGQKASSVKAVDAIGQTAVLCWHAARADHDGVSSAGVLMCLTVHQVVSKLHAHAALSVVEAVHPNNVTLYCPYLQSYVSTSNIDVPPLLQASCAHH